MPKGPKVGDSEDRGKDTLKMPSSIEAAPRARAKDGWQGSAPIRELQGRATALGWIPIKSRACLYVSAGADTRPFSYLRPEALTNLDLDEEVFPRFFVLVEKASPLENRIEFEDQHSRVETGVFHPLQLGRLPAAMLKLVVRSDRFPKRTIAVLRVKASNEEFAKAALAEEWSPTWFVGVRDGCAFGGNWRCENEVRDFKVSIPLRLGVRFWVTDHLAGIQLLDKDRHRIRPHRKSVSAAGGRELRQLAAWRRWPGTNYGSDRWVTLYELGKMESVERLNQTKRPEQLANGPWFEPANPPVPMTLFPAP